MPVELKNILKVSDPKGLTYYLGTFTAGEIKQLTFVPVVVPSVSPGEQPLLNEEPDGYQRAGDRKRMDNIRRFVLGRPSCLIPPVLLCARGQWEFVPSPSNKNVGTIHANALAAIIDGQHRLGGLWLVATEAEDDELLRRPIPFMAVDDLSVSAEQQEFVDINDNQKGVKKSLLRYLHLERSFSGVAARALMEDEESVFKGRIDIQKKKDWTLILFGAAQECVDLMFSKDFTVVTKFNPNDASEAALEFVLEYWRHVRDHLPDYWSDFYKLPAVGGPKSKEHPGTSGFSYRLLEETGIRAFSKFAAKAFQINWVDGIKAPSWDGIDRMLDDLAASDHIRRVLTKPKIDPDVLSLDPDLRSTGKAGVDAIYRHLEAEALRAKAN